MRDNHDRNTAVNFPSCVYCHRESCICAELVGASLCGTEAAESSIEMERSYQIGDQVVYTDPKGGRHNAVVTNWWNGSNPKGCNLVFVSDDETKTDPYGRQIERETSVSHKSVSGMPGRYWTWPDE